MEHTSEKKFPLSSKDYNLYEEIGEGVSATVYRALCVPLNEIVAIKVLDLEKCNNDLDGIRREVQTMSMIDHPNLVQARCSFTAGHSLWVVMPYMAGGSCLHIMKTAYPEGFEEPVIAVVLREVLKALVYLHSHGHIHRDVKAGNILVDSKGNVKLADFGVSTCMFDSGDRQRNRNTFVGTPCWMAPEVMQQLHGYDFKADIWSFGITALELAHGHAPFSKYPPMKVLLMTLQNAPPGLDYERDKRFSKSFKEMVAACLVKDPKKRPTAEKLLKHNFFKNVRSSEYLARTILLGLSPLGDRFRTLKAKEADFLVQNKAMYGDKEQMSQQEYIRGISAWNFNLEDLRAQASLIQDYDEISSTEDVDSSSKQEDGSDNVEAERDRLPSERFDHSNAAPMQEDELNDLQNLENSLASFPIRPLEALKGCFDVGDDDVNTSSPNWKDAMPLDSEHFPLQQPQQAEEQEARKNGCGNPERSSSLPKYNFPAQSRRFLSGSLLPESVLSTTRKVNEDEDRDYLRPKYHPERNYSGPLLHRQKRDANNLISVEETSDGTVVQQKGRFKITSADLSSVGASTNCLVNHACGGSTSPTTPTIKVASVLPSLQHILQQNTMQREQLVKVIKYLEQTSGHHADLAGAGTSALLQITPASVRERELQGQVALLQQSIGSVVEELQRVKLKNTQLERQLIFFNKEEDRIHETEQL